MLAGGIRVKCPSGKNERLQHGPAALVRHAQPGNHLAAGKSLLFGGIHLPNLMRPFGTGLGRLMRTTCRRRRSGIIAQPSLHGPFGRQRLIAIQFFQFQQQSSRTPARMLLPEFQSAATKFGKVFGTAHTCFLVIGAQRFLASFLNVPNQPANGSFGDLEFQCNLHGQLSGLRLPPNRLSNRGGKCAWHDRLLPK